jgi:hypothetical protein
VDESVKEKWDFLQKKLRCCGAQDWNEYRNAEDAEDGPHKYLIPESCCYDYGTENPSHCETSMPRDARNLQEELLSIDRFYVRGCLAILEQKYTVRKN